MQDTGITGRWHRARAVALGATAAVGALIATYAAWGGMLGELHRLERRSTVRTPDALPVLLWAALVLALLWATALIVLATATLLRSALLHSTLGAGGDGGLDDGNDIGSGGSGGQRPAGMIGRLAAVLLAVTALSSLSTAAPAFAASTPTVASASAAPQATAATTVFPTAAGHGAKHAESTSDSCTDADPPAPGWVPDKPARTDQVARECAPLVTGKPVADDSGEVVVHRGDTLWSIAAAHLGPHADAQAIAAEWPRWYAANREVIGDDPDQLSIGTRLQTPDHALEGSNR